MNANDVVTLFFQLSGRKINPDDWEVLMVLALITLLGERLDENNSQVLDAQQKAIEIRTNLDADFLEKMKADIEPMKEVIASVAESIHVLKKTREEILFDLLNKASLTAQKETEKTLIPFENSIKEKFKGITILLGVVAILLLINIVVAIMLNIT